MRKRSQAPFAQWMLWIAWCASWSMAQSGLWAQKRPQATMAALNRIRPMVESAIAAKEIPGCVIMIVHRGERVFFEAFGNRSLQPQVESMTKDTIFDMASITKPVATATSVMMLVERGQLRLSDKIADHLPEFDQAGKGDVTVFQCLTHQAGFVPDSPLSEYTEREQIWPNLYRLGLDYEPGSKFVYSDVGFQILGELVHRISGVPLNEFATQSIFAPLGMTDTGFLPPEDKHERCAVTEQREGRWMRGEVHDPRSYAMGGVAGHAGLFSTAEDLERYARMMLAGGTYRDQRILAGSTIDLMTAAYRSGDSLRGLGWDKRSRYSTNRGENFSVEAFGHGGFTGTAMWIDPRHELVVILLSNRVHPDGSGTVNRLAGRIGTLAAATLSPQRLMDPELESTASAERLFAGIDVIEVHGFADLAGRKVGLITNQTGCNRKGERTAALLHDTAQVDLVCLFSPEHGIAGRLDQSEVADAVDEDTGLPIYSLYGKTRSPAAEHLQKIDTLVFDIQDIGTRFYTYISTMGNAMRVAAEHEIEFWVLDRPNPIGGSRVAGPVLDAGRESFVGFHTIPVRHGMTVGELAKMFADELDIDVKLQVVQVERWKRRMMWDQTQLLWINPSPNMRNPKQALLYPGIGLLETTNLSVGRGTDTPFEIVGAPWVNAQSLAQRLNQAQMPGVRFVPIRFTPDSSKFANESCQGVRMEIVCRHRVAPLRIGIELACALRDLYSSDWQLEKMDRLLCDANVLQMLKEGAPPDRILASWQAELADFERRRERYLIYK